MTTSMATAMTVTTTRIPRRVLWVRISTLCGLALLAALAGPAAQGQDDATAVGPVQVGPLHTVTIGTENLADTVRFLRDGLGMFAVGPVLLPGRLDDRMARQWGLGGERWSMYLFQRNGAPGAVQVRVLYYTRAGKVARVSSDPREPGPWALSFPAGDVARWEADLRRAGYDALTMSPGERRDVRPDGSEERFPEVVFTGPERVQAYLRGRMPSAAQTITDPTTGRSGPSAAVLLTPEPGRLLAFFVQGLGLELRSDRESAAADWPALGLGPAVRFRELRLAASGASDSEGMIEILDFGDRALPSLSTPPRPPTRGMTILSFPVTNLDLVLARLRGLGFRDQEFPIEAAVPGLESSRVATAVAPNGMLIELFERATP